MFLGHNIKLGPNYVSRLACSRVDTARRSPSGRTYRFVEMAEITDHIGLGYIAVFDCYHVRDQILENVALVTDSVMYLPVGCRVRVFGPEGPGIPSHSRRRREGPVGAGGGRLRCGIG
jgi:hypothetical protein